MSHEIYASLSGALAVWQQTELTANNLANVSTNAFKEQRATYEQVARDARPLGNSFSRLVPGFVNQSDGPIIQDDVDTHIAVRGGGFLVVQTHSGETLLTRNGNLRLDATRTLVTQDGEWVLGQTGPIRIPEGEKLEIDRFGNVTTRADDGFEVAVRQVDQLRIMSAEGLIPRGGGRYEPEGLVGDAPYAEIVQGALEGSNVDPMREMVELIQTARYFDIYQKAIQTSDSLDQTIYALPRG